MKLMARSPQPFSSSAPSPRARAVDTARQGLYLQLAYPSKETLPNILATNALTGQVIDHVPTEIRELARNLTGQNPHYDVLQALLNYIHLFTGALTSGFKNSLESSCGNQWPLAFNSLGKQHPDLFGLHVIPQSTDPSKEAALIISPSSIEITQFSFNGKPPKLRLSAMLADDTSSKNLTLQGNVLTQNDASVGMLGAIEKKLAQETQRFALEVNQRR